MKGASGMKAMILGFMSAFAALAAVAGNGAAEADAAQKERIAAWKKCTGGYVKQEDPGNGMVAILNKQKRIGKRALASVAKYYREFTGSMPFAVVEGRAPHNAVYVVEVIDDPGVVHPLTIWPESRKAQVNIAPLARGAGEEEKLESRTLKEVSRAIALLAGGGSQYPGTLAGTEGEAAGADKFKGFQMPPDVFLRIGTNLRALDVRPERRITYLEAVQEGWAPPPTNDVQRAIWRKVHSLPDKPITIEFDPKKGR